MAEIGVTDRVHAVTTKLGGKPVLRIVVKAGDDVVDSLLSTSEGGRKTAVGLRDLVADAHDGSFDVELLREPGCPSPGLASQLSEMAVGPSPRRSETTRLFEAEPDVVVFSLSCDLATHPDDFSRSMREVIGLIKEHVGAHVFVYNCSSIDPGEPGPPYRGRVDLPSLRIHRLNLRLVELSMLEGISVIDADRVLAELGARDHVTRLLDYSSAAAEALGREFLRVLSDYGFFERRPLVPQLGARAPA